MNSFSHCRHILIYNIMYDLWLYGRHSIQFKPFKLITKLGSVSLELQNSRYNRHSIQSYMLKHASRVHYCNQFVDASSWPCSIFSMFRFFYKLIFSLSWKHQGPNKTELQYCYINMSNFFLVLHIIWVNLITEISDCLEICV